MTQEIGITFDLWDTLIIDDSDEEIRARLGLRSKREQRYHVMFKAFGSVSNYSFDEVRRVYDKVSDEFNQVWHNEFVTWSVRERVNRISSMLNCDLPDEVLNNAIFALENMEIEVQPRAMPGAYDALEEISKRYPLAIVSDAIVTPGRNLRKWLESKNLLHFFQAFAFSDEVGHSKPHSTMFQAISTQLNVPVQNLVHVGDREHNDIRGAHALGMRAILFTGSRAIDAANSSADAICNHCRDLPAVIDRLIRSETKSH